MSVFEDLQKKFGNIYVLTLSNRKDRQDHIKSQLKSIGMENEKDVNTIYATPFKYNDIIINAFNNTGDGRFTKPNEYDCSRNHYSIVKQAYDLGYDYCLIIEDDILFLDNDELFSKYIENIPEDFDVLQFGGFTVDPKIDKYLGEDKGYWMKHKDVGVWNASMYALSREGMEFYIIFMNTIFWVADGPLYKAPLNDKIVNTYISSIPLVIQEDKHIISSDIRDDKTDSIDYNNDNRYEQYINNYKYKH